MPDFEFKILDIAAKGGFVAAELIGAGTSMGPAELPGARHFLPQVVVLSLNLAPSFESTPKV
jgi:hypothetical protein